MRKKLIGLLLVISLLVTCTPVAAKTPTIKLGNEMLLERYREIIRGKRVGLITNQSGVNSKGQSLIDILAAADDFQLTALYAPEHGIDAVSYTHLPLSGLQGTGCRHQPDTSRNRTLQRSRACSSNRMDWA